MSAWQTSRSCHPWFGLPVNLPLTLYLTTHIGVEGMKKSTCIFFFFFKPEGDARCKNHGDYFSPSSSSQVPWTLSALNAVGWFLPVLNSYNTFWMSQVHSRLLDVPCELVVSSQQVSKIFMNVYLKSSYSNISSNISTIFDHLYCAVCLVYINLVIRIIV